jgi:hypothetical protein
MLIMGAVQNTMRRFVVAGSPVATGLVGVGDAICTTNPTLGRGLSLALSGAVDLLHIIERYPDDRGAQALAMDEMVQEHVLPFYEDQVAIDAARLAILEHRIFNGPCPPPAFRNSNVINFGQLRTAAQFDPVAFRAFWKIMGMTSRPQEVYSDPEVVARTRSVLDRQGSGPMMEQPTREQLLAALANQSTGAQLDTSLLV